MRTLPEFLPSRTLNEVCTLGIGGLAEMYLSVHSIEEMQEALRMCHREGYRYIILGKGSNVLFDDRGFKGLVIHNKIDFLQEADDGIFYAGAGFSYSLLGTRTARQGWGGLEFASGIPGSVGGAVFMNAGANGKETCDYLSAVDFVCEEGKLHHFEVAELKFSYRHSSFHCLKGAIVASKFKLIPSKEARKKQLDIIDYRTKTQPYKERSAGCVFRNSEKGPAGALIDQCGLKGLRVGGAQVSEVHANFIVNIGEGTSLDFINLANTIQQKVKEKMGVSLEREIRIIPYCELA